MILRYQIGPLINICEVNDYLQTYIDYNGLCIDTSNRHWTPVACFNPNT